MIDISIGPYKICKRTEYSKTQVLDRFGQNLLNTDMRIIAEKILSDYNNQTKYEKTYFDVEG